MKKEYVAPIMYMEAFVAEQYVAADSCGVSVGTPEHGHVQIKEEKDGKTAIHCAFTSSNCGSNAQSCLSGKTSQECKTIDGDHYIISEEDGNASKPTVGAHNCHILSTNDAATAFANDYKDRICAEGVLELMGLNEFKDIYNAFS